MKVSGRLAKDHGIDRHLAGERRRARAFRPTACEVQSELKLTEHC